MSKEIFASGECLCGSVKYKIFSAPVRMGQCHCDDCRKLSGTGHSSNAFFNVEDMVIEGETSSYDSVSDTGSTITRYFCPECGSRLFGKSSIVPGIMNVTAGTLDDSSWFKPDRIVYNKRKPAWDVMDETIPTFEEMPPMPGK